MTDARTRGALVAAALVGAFLLVQEIVGNIAGLRYGGAPGFIAAQTGSTIIDFFTRIVPIALGVFVVFWRFLAPITGDLTVKQVLLRSLVASAAGTVVGAVITGVVRALEAAGSALFGNSFPFEAVGDAFDSFAVWIAPILTGFVGLVPLVTLAAVLFWLWLRARSA